MKLTIKGEITITTERGYKISPRIIEVLKMVEKTGSLNRAVKEMELSYSYIWNTLYKLNCHLDAPLIETQRGGSGGGESFLTDKGKELISQYEKLEKNFEIFLQEKQLKC